ncbi:MAG TPA: trypsin-like serine protease [Oligoflexus sp.]|uniref:trypsin-like serine protease n=1 Tax=Oligoflexus sp. TaxID=1971216 RepID=UPI002D2C92C7|nr:trypsin-like serine protease [Oligoflexus sp.]HYX36313.1 trypsin-like serine protease [Oligoflexus sp.]
MKFQAIYICAGLFLLGCGATSQESSSTKVTRGFEVEEAAYPSIAYFTFSDGGGSYVCTGTFVTDRHLLTAGHCTGDGGTATILRGDARDATSTRLRVHPKYQHDRWYETSRYDLAVYEFPRGTAPEVSRIRATPIEGDEAGLMIGYGVSNLLEDSGLGVKRMGINKVTSKHDGKIHMAGQPDGPQLEFASNQSILGGGDSGGPLLYFRSGTHQDIVGVASGGSNGTSFWVDLHSQDSKDFLRSLGIQY